MSENSPGDAAALRALIAVLGLCGFASTFTMRLIDPLVPTLAGEFSRSIPQAALLATAFSFSYALGQPFLGPIADTIGKLRSITICLAALCVLSTLAAFASSFSMLLGLRAAAGVVAGGVIPAAMAAIGDRAPMGERQIMLGRFLVIMIVGQMSGAAFSGIVADHIGWRAVLAIAGGLAAGGALLIRFGLKPRANAQRQPLGLSSAVSAYRHVFSNPKSRILYPIMIAEGILVFGLPPYVAAILQERSTIGPTEAGIAIGAIGCGGILYGLLTRVLVRHLGPARMTTIGSFVMALSYLLFALPLPWWTAIAIFMLMGFGFFLMHGTFQAQATELAPQARGSAVALFACFFFLGSATGPLLMGFALHLAGNGWALTLFALGLATLGLIAPRLLSLPGRRD